MDKVLNPPSGDSGWATGRSTTVRSSSEGMTAAVTVCTIAVRSTVGGGTGVSVGGGTGVWVGGMGALVGGTGVSVGGMGVSVGNGVGVETGVLVGMGVIVGVGVGATYCCCCKVTLPNTPGIEVRPRYTFRVIKRLEVVATSS